MLFALTVLSVSMVSITNYKVPDVVFAFCDWFQSAVSVLVSLCVTVYSAVNCTDEFFYNKQQQKI